jgi:hypothetical protein
MKKLFNIPNEDVGFTQAWDSSMNNKKKRNSAGNRAVSVLFN